MFFIFQIVEIDCIGAHLAFFRAADALSRTIGFELVILAGSNFSDTPYLPLPADFGKVQLQRRIVCQFGFDSFNNGVGLVFGVRYDDGIVFGIAHFAPKGKRLYGQRCFRLAARCRTRLQDRFRLFFDFGQFRVCPSMEDRLAVVGEIVRQISLAEKTECFRRTLHHFGATLGNIRRCGRQSDTRRTDAPIDVCPDGGHSGTQFGLA